MKIKSLTIHNIASIADAFIDFDSPELSGADIFLITGNTGSGKSTILDCICLALYNTAPRLKSTLMEGRLEQKGEYNGISLSDPRQLLSRNAGEGFVELVFEGNNGRVYTARWSTQRAYAKPSGRLQKVTHTFTCGEHVFMGENLREERRSAIGVEYDEFVRTSMLAQGEFTRFLNCSDKEKSEVLMQILNVDEYEKISRKIHERTAAEKESLEKLKSQADAFELLTPEQDSALAEEKSLLLFRVEELHKSQDADTLRQRWFTDLDTLCASIEKAKELFGRMSDEMASESFAKDERFINDYDSASDVLALLRDAFSIRNKLAVSKIGLINLSDSFAVCRANLVHVEGQLADTKAEMAASERFFEDNKAFGNTVERRSLVEQNVRNYLAAKNRLNENTAQLATLNKVISSHTEVRDKAVSKVKNAEEILGKARAELAAITDVLSQKNPEALQARETELTTRAGALALASNLAATLKTQSDELADALRGIANLKAVIERLQSDLVNATKEVELRKALLDQATKIYEKASMSVCDWSRRLRNELSIGDICPVCRRRIDERFESDEEIERALAPLRKAVEESAANSQASLDAANALRVELASQQKLLASAEADLVRRRAGIDQQKQRLDSCCSTLAVQAAEIEAETAKCAEAITALKPLLAEARALSAAAETLRRKVDEAVRAKAEADESLRGIENKLAECLARKSSLEALSMSETSQMDKFSSALAVDVTGPWKSPWSEQPFLFLEELEKIAGLFKNASDRKENLARECERLENTLAVCRPLEESLAGVLPQNARENPEFRPIPRLENEFYNLKAQTEANLKEQSDLSAKLDELKNLVRQRIELNIDWKLLPLCRMLGKSAGEIQSVRSRVEKAKRELAEARAVYEAGLRQREEHLAARPEMAADETVEAIAVRLKSAREETDVCVARLAVIDDTRHRDAELRLRLAGIIEKLEKQKTVFADWQQLDRHFGSADGRQFCKIALRYVLGHLLDKANIYLRRIMPRYRLHCRPDSFIIMVEDAYQNGAMRSANVISGGESFIVSLVLALALSDVESHFNADILFIDEGFGSLSGDALESAVETLRGLRSHGGRRVGIISHIAELRERIPVKIFVKRDGFGASSVSVGLG